MPETLYLTVDLLDRYLGIDNLGLCLDIELRVVSSKKVYYYYRSLRHCSLRVNFIVQCW